jgi:hypothetical protein
MTSFSRRCLTSTRPAAILLLAACLLSILVSAPAASAASRSRAATHEVSARAAARLVPINLRTAAKRRSQADRVLVSTARALRRCLRAHPRHSKGCQAKRRALQRAGSRLAHAEGLLSQIARRTGTASSVSGATSAPASSSTVASPRMAPTITVSGRTLSWARVDGINTYLFVRKVPRQADEYSLVSGTSITPPAVPGATVRYSVRTTTLFSAWAAEVSITYPVGEKTEGPGTKAAPALSVSGQTLNWSTTPGVNTYLLVAKVQGRADRYSVVGGTSNTPEALPGGTVRYSVRTAVEGSAWASEVSISYPAVEPPPPPPPPPPHPALQTGLNSGTEPVDLSAAATLGAKLVRLAFPIGAPASQLEAAIAKYAAQGVRVLPMADFSGRMPTPAEAQNLAGWAKAYGPGGTFWAGRPDGSLAMQSIEFGNETDFSGQYHDKPGDASYRLRAETYALRIKEAAQAIQAAGAKVGILAQEDDTSGVWISGMYAAVPDLTNYVAGWTMHPYGGKEYNVYRFQMLIKQTAEHGASAIPIAVTEWGVTTDSGHCLSYNEGLNRCMSYQEAAETLKNTFTWMTQMLGSRLTTFIFYQVRDQQRTGATTDWQAYFGALQHELQPKGAYTEAVQALLRS